jgi:hypothetical protein
MSVFDNRNLLESLSIDVSDLVAVLIRLRANDNIEWNVQPEAGKWSPVQIIEHLNSYNRYYLPEIRKALETGNKNHIKYNPRFKSGWVGDYFTRIMLPGNDGKICNRMNAPKDHRPQIQLDTSKVLDEFMNAQQLLTAYLNEAAETDIAKLKVPISINRFIKLKLGDTFRFLIAHQQRHFVQLNNTLNK